MEKIYSRRSFVTRNILLVVGIVTFLAVVGAYNQLPMVGGDFGWHLLNGQMILRTHAIVHRQVLAQVSRGQYWSDTSWLWDAGTAYLYNLFGMGGIALLVWAIAVLTALVLAWQARGVRMSVAILGALIVGFGFSLAMPERPEILSYLLFAITLVALERLRAGSALMLWLSLALLPVWVNAHGSWPLWFAVLAWEALWARGRARNLLLISMAVGLALAFLQPTGPMVFMHFAGHIVSRGNLGIIQEWSTPNFHNPVMFLFGLAAILMPLLVGRRLLEAKDWARIGWVVGASLAVLVVARFIPYAAIGFFLLLISMPAARSADGARASWLHTVGAGVVILTTLTYVAMHFSMSTNPLAKDYAYLKAHKANDVFNMYQYGGGLELAGITPYLDGRNDLWLVHPYWRRYVGVIEGSYPIALYLAKYDPKATWVLWDANSAVKWQMDAMRGWKMVYVEDGVGIWHKGA